MTNDSIKPDDILADSENFVELNGLTVCKGSIAAFLKNIDLFEDSNSKNLSKRLCKLQKYSYPCKYKYYRNHAIYKERYEKGKES